jgi:cytochrome P450 family 628
MRSLHGISDIKDHAARRRIWEKAFTPKALAEFQHNADALLDELINNLDKVAKTGTSIDMAMWSNLYSFDGQS